ncbi:MAG: hypothetical protein M0P69_14880 [Bacteroidales bacterium]|nr:hypothetical protein [Bacteroidales bacterium]
MTDKQQEALAKIEQIREDYRRVFSTASGKRVLEDLKVSAYYNKTSFSLDALQMAYNEGARTVVLHIENMSKPQDKPKGVAIREGDTDE